MKKLRFSPFLCVGSSLALALSLSAQVGAPPTLQSRLLAAGQVELSWTSPGSDFVLDSAGSIQPPVLWRQTSHTPAQANGRFHVTLATTDRVQFFRLRQAAAAEIYETSPSDGETGVAVTRETILRFSAPLSAETLLDNEQFEARLGTRRILSRATLSADRTTATLFYLEPLPASARIHVTFDGGGISDASGQPLDLDGDGMAGGVFALSFSTTATAGAENTGIVGHVYATEQGANGANVPLEGAIVSVDGAEETLRVRTDAAGFFRLQPAPVGRFFVHVDGRTAKGSDWPRGSYYPFVGKAWETLPGKTNNLANGNGVVFLPLIPGEALKAVSATEETRITFSPSVFASNPALAGVSITVPADSLFSEDGARGGKVGIAAVPPDRLPEPLPAGLALPVVITIQTDGPMNFDRPVPVRFPNLPDPVTGLKLPPGAKTVLWSFNHDTGRWEPQGSATITADGNFAETDPGVGARQPGWHGVAPGSPGRGPKPNWPEARKKECEELFDCDNDGCAESNISCPDDCERFPKEISRLEPYCPLNKSFANQINAFFCGGPFIDCPDPAWKQKFLMCRGQLKDLKFEYIKCIGRGGSMPQLASLSALQAPTQGDQERLVAAAALPFTLLLGSHEWTQVDLAEEAKWIPLLGSLQIAIGAQSAGGKQIDAGERTAIQTLTLPSNLTRAMVQTAIQRLNAFNDGSLPAAEAQAIDSALSDYATRWRQLQAEGWRTTSDGIFAAEAAASADVSEAARRTFFSGRRLYYAIQNLENGFQFRGRLNERGFFENIVLPMDAYMQVEYLDPITLARGSAVFRSAIMGTDIPPAPMSLLADEPDLDGDGVSDAAEGIAGTAPNKADTDGDGISDMQEFQSDLNPLDGLGQSLGVLASLKVSGSAVNIAVDNGIAVLIGRFPLAIVDVRNPEEPVLVNQMGGLADQTEIAFEFPWLAVGDISTGVRLLNLGNLASPETRWAFKPSAGNPTALALGHGHVFVATASSLIVLDLASGRTIFELPGNGFSGLVLEGDHLYGARSGTPWLLVALKLEEGGRRIVVEGSIQVPGGLAPQETEPALFVADGHAYLGFFQGYKVIDVRNPRSPVLVGESITVQSAIHALDLDSGGHLATSTSFGGQQSIQVSIYDGSDPTVTTNLLSGFDTPGTANKLALYEGRLFLADGTGGFAAANYRSREFGTNPPSVTLTAYTTLSDPPVQESSTVFRLSSRAADDVFTEGVDFYLDGQRVAGAGAMPFEADVQAPALSATKRSFVVQARAFDSAGNSGWSAALTIGLTNELRPPVLVSFAPHHDARYVTNTVVEIAAAFNEPMSLSSLNAELTLTSAGPDETFGTADDFPLSSTVSPGGPANSILDFKYVLHFAQPLPSGFYRVSATTNLLDLHGNHLANGSDWQFGIRPAYFLLNGTVWNQEPATAAGWSAGRIPTANDFVRIDRAGDPQISASRSIAAYDLVVRNPISFESDQIFGTQLQISDRAVFEDSVALHGQIGWHGGEAFVMDDLTATGSSGSFVVSNHILNNHGHVTIGYGESGGLVLRNTVVGLQTVVRNHPGATWEQVNGSISRTLATPSAEFENHGLFAKRGASPSRVDLDRFVNTGTVEVMEGTLTFQGGLGGYRSQHFGAYLVDAGATLEFVSSTIDFARTTRIYGPGNVRFWSGRDTPKPFPGAHEISGTTDVRAPTDFTGTIRTSGPWDVREEVRISGLQPQLTGPIAIHRGGRLIVQSLSGVRLNSLTSSNDLVITTSLEVNGPLILRGGRVYGLGRLRANGPVSFGGNVSGFDFEGSSRGQFEIAGAALGEDNAAVLIAGMTLRILQGGSLDLGRAGAFSFGGQPIVNEGTLVKTNPGPTTLFGPIHNRDRFQVSGGTLTVENGGLLQFSGSTTIDTDSITFRPRPGFSADTTVNLQGGRLDARAVMTCGSVTNAAELSLGAAIGTLDLRIGDHPVYSVYQQMPSGSLIIDIAGPQAGTGHDDLKMTGRALLAGTLEVNVADNYDPPINQEFTIITCMKREGTFSNMTGTQLAGGKHLEVVYGDTAVKLRVVGP